MWLEWWGNEGEAVSVCGLGVTGKLEHCIVCSVGVVKTCDVREVMKYSSSSVATK